MTELGTITFGLIIIAAAVGGAAILSDGRVGLILNIEQVCSRLHRASQATRSRRALAHAEESAP
mgnify:CR=1 FL=1